MEISSILFFCGQFSKLGTHGSPRRRGTGHEPPPPPVKNLGLGDVKRFIEGMHNTESISGRCAHLS